MPIGGFDGLGWDETTPSDSEAVSLGDDRIRSLKTSLRNALDAEHSWPSAGGNSVGYHRFGSARPYYGPQSNVSSSGSDGRLMLTSDTSRLFAVGSGGTVYLGGTLGLSIGTSAGFGYPQRHHWVEEVGLTQTGSTGSVTVTIPNSGFSGIPYVTATVAGPVSQGVFASVTTVSGTEFILSTIAAAGAVFTGNQNVFWRSLGTRVL